MLALIMLHVPIGIAMAVAGFGGILMISGFDTTTKMFATYPTEVLTNQSLGAIPMFLLMGSFAAAAGLSTDLYRLFYALLGHYRGGLAMTTIAGCGGFGAICGSSLATASTFMRIALPEMTERKYRPTLAVGSIAAGGTLGMIIPPSLVMIIYGILTEEFIIALFAAAVIPGLISVVFYFITIAIVARVNPEAGPTGPRMPWPERWRIARECWGIVFLATVVSVGIYTGIFSVTEAASIGATIALVFAFARGRLNRRTFLETIRETAGNTGFIYVIIMGASIFAYFVTLSHLPDAVVTGIMGLGLPPLAVIFLFVLMYLVLGSVFDTVAAMVITLPFVFPLIVGLGFDPIWFGVINVMVIEIGMITPPIGINVFVLHGIARDIPLGTIFRGIGPFLVADLVRLTILTFSPVLAIWLPEKMGMLM